MKVMTNRLKAIAVTGKYTSATVEYSGLVAYSLVDRGGTAAMQILAAGKYIPGTIEYAGRVVSSAADRGGAAAKKCLVKVFQPVGAAAERPFAFVKGKVFQPVGSAVAKPFVFVKDKAKNIFPVQIRYDEDIKNISEKIMTIEDRLSYIEQHGVVMKGGAEAEKKAINKEKRQLLQVILAENKLLRESG
jgi:hypothetical protein